jgi:hypothetical protein
MLLARLARLVEAAPEQARRCLRIVEPASQIGADAVRIRPACGRDLFRHGIDAVDDEAHTLILAVEFLAKQKAFLLALRAQRLDAREGILHLRDLRLHLRLIPAVQRFAAPALLIVGLTEIPVRQIGVLAEQPSDLAGRRLLRIVADGLEEKADRLRPFLVVERLHALLERLVVGYESWRVQYEQSRDQDSGRGRASGHG